MGTGGGRFWVRRAVFRRLLLAAAPPPKSIALDDAVFSMLRPSPNDARLADGDDGETGEPVTRLRRLPSGSKEGAGDSWKNEPRSGDPLRDPAALNAGECCSDEGRRQGESRSIPEPPDELRGDIMIGSVCYRVSRET